MPLQPIVHEVGELTEEDIRKLEEENTRAEQILASIPQDERAAHAGEVIGLDTEAGVYVFGKTPADAVAAMEAAHGPEGSIEFHGTDAASEQLIKEHFERLLQ